MADAGEIGSAVANKPRAASCVPRANIQRAVGLEAVGAGFGEEVREKLRLCMADRVVSFLADWGDRAIGFSLRIYRTLWIALRSIVFLSIFVGILTVTHI
ncbi:hypothetical protein QUA27_10935 [Microcoleus sp. Pol14C6]|uniref:hypothetical protein n=1 Tax=unclassified Microcoleus TaxID=2642155 RepID=UPI002FD2C124